MAANRLVMDSSEQITYQLRYLQNQKLLTLCSRSFLGVATTTLTILPIMAANISIIGKSCSIAFGLYKMRYPKLLTLCWRAFSNCGCYRVTVSFAYKDCQYVDYGHQEANRFPIVLLIRPKILDALLTLIFTCGNFDINHIAYTGGQYFDYG